MDEDLSAELLERVDRDQAARLSLRSGDGFPEWEKVVAPIDRDNTARMREIIAQYGWPGRELVGDAGAHAAWLLVQHADADKTFQRKCLDLMAKLPKGEVSRMDLA